MTIEKIHNIETDEIVEREFTVKEIEAMNKAAAQAQAQIEAAEQASIDLAALKASAKAKLIAGEPLSAEEAETLVF